MSTFLSKFKFQLTIHILMVTLVSATSCSPSNDAHFPDKKTFGKKENDSTTNNPPLDLDSNTPGNSPSEPTGPTEPEPGETQQPNPDQEEEYTFDQTLFHFQFQGGFDQKSLQRIVNKSSSGPVKEGELVSNNILIDPLVDSFFSNAINVQGPETLDLIIRENGKGFFKVPMIGLTTKGDNLQRENGSSETASGDQILYWTTDAEALARSTCPKTFICVERLTWQPTKGQDWTYCMRHPQTRLPMPVPFSPNPNFTKDAFEASVPTKLESPVVLVSKHPGIQSCDDPEIVTQSIDTIKWTVTPMSAAASTQRGFYKYATYNSLPADVAMKIDIQRYSYPLGRTFQPRKAPYVDQSTRLNSRVIYYLNTAERVYTKAVRSSQEPVNTFPGTFVSNGIQVDYHFELCQPVSATTPTFNHCTGRWSTP